MPALLAAGHRVARCDLRGFGRTSAPDRPHNDAEDVLDLLDALGIERAALVASSYGGRVALEIAARRPGRVSSMALLCTALAGHEPTAGLRAFAQPGTRCASSGRPLTYRRPPQSTTSTWRRGTASAYSSWRAGLSPNLFH